MSPPSSSSSSSITIKNPQIQNNQTLTLIPGLPNDLARLILSFIPYSHHARLKSISKSWRIFLSSKTLISLRQRSKLCLSHLICVFPQDPAIYSPYLFDPQNVAWCPLPPMPCNPHVYGLCNFTSVGVDTHMYVLGGSLFDTRAYPMDRPCSSKEMFRFDFVTRQWDKLSPMLSPRGSFACVVVPGEGNRIIVAGGGSRHSMFGAAGSRMSSVEMYDVGKDEWVALDGLPRFRAGCVGFLVGNGEEVEFWVMGGYGESRTVFGVFPVDEYYRDAVVMEVKNGGKWRELGNMWEEGERMRLGRIAVVEGEGSDVPGIFMLDESDIFRYDVSSNRWGRETSVPRKATDESSIGFVASGGELHILSLLSGIDSTDSRRSRHDKRSATLLVQIYNPRRRTWRSLITKPPFSIPLDLKTAVMCTIKL